MVPELSKTDLQKPRTQTELRAWVDRLHSQFGRTKQGRRAMRLNDGHLVKEFKEEVWPLALFADAFYMGNEDVRFQAILGGQSYDAVILESNSCKISHLQITQSFARGGDQNRRLNEHLVDYGRAPGTGATFARGPNSKLVREANLEAVDRDQLLNQIFEHIQDAVKRKSLMRCERETSLIVQFEDDFIDSEKGSLALDRFVRSNVAPSSANFAALYLVSDCNRLAFSYKTKAEHAAPAIGALYRRV